MTESIVKNSKNNGTGIAAAESVADILERQLDDVIHEWLALIEEQEDLMSIRLSYEERTGHLPALLHAELLIAGVHSTGRCNTI